MGKLPVLWDRHDGPARAGKGTLSSSPSLGVLPENPGCCRERWLSRWHSASTGNQHLPKGEPCPCRPSSLPRRPSRSGAARGGEPCSPLKASPPFTAPGDVLRELSLGAESKCPSSPGRRPRPSLVPPPRQHTAELGLAAASHPECPETLGLRKVSSREKPPSRALPGCRHLGRAPLMSHLNLSVHNRRPSPPCCIFCMPGSGAGRCQAAPSSSRKQERQEEVGEMPDKFKACRAKFLAAASQ